MITSQSDKPSKTTAPKAKAASTVARKSASTARAKTVSVRQESKTSKVLSLLRRPKGVALNELTKATAGRRIPFADFCPAPCARRWDWQSNAGGIYPHARTSFGLRELRIPA